MGSSGRLGSALERVRAAVCARAWSRACTVAADHFMGESSRAGWPFERGMSGARAWEGMLTADSLFAGSPAFRDRFFARVWARFLLPRTLVRVLALAGLVAGLLLAPGPVWVRWLLVGQLVLVVLLVTRAGTVTRSRVVASAQDAARRARFARAHALALPSAGLRDPAVASVVLAGLAPEVREVVEALAPTWSGTLGELVVLASTDLDLAAR